MCGASAGRTAVAEAWGDMEILHAEERRDECFEPSGARGDMAVRLASIEKALSPRVKAKVGR